MKSHARVVVVGGGIMGAGLLYHLAKEDDFRTPTTLVGAGFDISTISDKSFIRKEALIRQFETGVSRMLVHFEIDATEADAIGIERIYADDRPIGLTTSGAYGHTVGKSLAFGFVEPEFATNGTALSIEILGRRCTARALRSGALHRFEGEPEKLGDGG